MNDPEMRPEGIPDRIEFNIPDRKVLAEVLYYFVQRRIMHVAYPGKKVMFYLVI